MTDESSQNNGIQVALGMNNASRERIDTIHISWAGPERWLECCGKVWVFEDHRYCGPIALTGKTREPSETQPPESSPFWQHVNAWYQQGKRTKEVGGKTWCVYETQMQGARKHGRASKSKPDTKQRGESP